MNISLILVIIAIVWLIVLSILLIWIIFVFKDLIKISKNKEFNDNSKEIVYLKSEVLKIKNISTNYIQRVGLSKYNPFKETGGNNSFSLVLLDGNKNGIIITSLHTRERTRFYLKEVKSGKSLIELSEDEAKALKESVK
ncbi:hypothetical protein A2130_01440 [Candidatus Woesebacteria bacterium GWC2_33_12]|uniref:DUF4446 domain-containing protein n=1 Tax=Candidatus Woesebacteria bacterium GW2011_GWB1_33_22 TaxID=1618566 RepID=A0A0G0C101_9BACT|nr:MAG: hypothetical protein UR29_C0007G0005 [Candidatus Woesebacteria bacterium GW2011_GWC2_33_12]KKP42141.1 MAG: hypothetical protein UR33_C0005G0005 [Candidatus Woesebacteria bacterium GW2011_GWA2_33_20]KKP44875.1 MAG: hypothetical protein UR35_C0005G0005 [Candidatus Woesebacteria bacterium GW2011_GWB1_33_22]KKP46689.1 MAG: hypothetical protein UR37_C0005G0005 [Microgenomates group bacterium GW2011_GWC1_33_28]KKP50589.1 MAG: hypothetical protein UR41_C0005G0005 [Candidatus Woesebacteria bact